MIKPKRAPAVKLRPVDHPKSGANHFCGPAILSALTGANTRLTAAVLREYTNRRAIYGTYAHELRRALNHFNLLAVSTSPPVDHRPTLARWHRDHKRAGLFKQGRVWLVSAGHHWLAVTANRYVCGQTIEVVSIKDARVKRRARVAAVWEIKQMPPHRRERY